MRVPEKFIGRPIHSNRIRFIFQHISLVVHTLILSLLQCLNPIGKKMSSVVDRFSYEHFTQWTFPSIFGSVNLYIRTYWLMYISTHFISLLISYLCLPQLIHTYLLIYLFLAIVISINLKEYKLLFSEFKFKH